MYHEEMQMLRFHANRIWESLAYITGLLTFFMSLTSAGLVFLTQVDAEVFRNLLLVGYLILPVFGLWMTYFGREELNRGYNRFLKSAFILTRTREKLTPEGCLGIWPKSFIFEKTKEDLGRYQLYHTKSTKNFLVIINKITVFFYVVFIAMILLDILLIYLSFSGLV